MGSEFEDVRKRINALIEKHGNEEVEEKIGVVVFGIKGRRMLHV